MVKKKSTVIAGMDADAWLEAESDSSKEPDITPKKYEKKIVAFLDLLAMKDLIWKIEPGNERETLETIDKIKGIVEIETEALEKDPSFSLLHISDSFIFTCSERDIVVLIQLLATIQMRILLECRFQLRGGITYGDVYVADEGKQIIGPAYIEAYLLQENNAIYPRIVLHDSLLNKITESQINPGNMILSNDTEMCIDYLEVFMRAEGKKEKEIITKLKRERVFDYLVDNYKEFHSKCLHSVKQKYGWTIQYFKSKGVWPSEKQYSVW